MVNNQRCSNCETIRGKYPHLEVFFCIEMHARPYENKLAIPSHPTSNMPGMYGSLLFD